MILKKYPFACLVLLLIFAVSVSISRAQDNKSVVLTGAALTQVVPTSFYYQGQSAPTQMRNAAAVRFAKDRNVIAGLVDTSGYSTDIAAKYQGFFITDTKIRIGGEELAVGAYGFGFTGDGKFNIQDISGDTIITVSSVNDKNLRRPRPLVFVKSGDEIRLYSGRSYVVIKR